MKVKHFAGYGCVEAEKLTRGTTYLSQYGDCQYITILVSGNHEYGLVLVNNNYRVEQWLLRRFVHNKEYHVVDYTTEDYYMRGNNIDVEHCRYCIYFK